MGSLPHISDAFDVSFNGHAVVHDNNGNSNHGLTPRAVFYGSVYQDNTIVAWGDIPGSIGIPPAPGVTMQTTDDFGVEPNGVEHFAAGQYTITLNPIDPVSGTGYSINHGSVTVTVEDAPTGNFCRFATSTAISANKFTVTIHDVSDCGHPKDNAFMFKVVGR